MVYDYLDEDVALDSSLVSELFQIAKRFDPENFINKEIVMDMYYVLSNIGSMDNAINNMNNFFSNVIKNDKSGIFTDNPFIIRKNPGVFLRNQFDNIETREEIIVNEITLANRLSKLAESAIKIDESSGLTKLDLDGKNNNTMTKMFSDYKKYREGKFDFISDIELDDNGDFDRQWENELKDDEKARIIEGYDEFTNWFSDEKRKFSKNSSDKSENDEENNIKKDIANFQKFSRMKICRENFYKIKNYGIKNILELNGKKGLLVYDATKYDSNEDEQKKLIRIDLAGYMFPFFVHCDVNQYEEIIGEKIEDKLQNSECSEYKYSPHINYKISEELLEYSKKIPNFITGIRDRSLRDVVEYYKKSSEKELHNREIQTMREKRNRDKDAIVSKQDVKEIIKTEEKKENNMENETQNLENLKEKEKNNKMKYPSDEHYINEEIVKVLENATSIKFSNDYKDALIYKKNQATLGYVYRTIESFMEGKFPDEKDNKKVKIETAKMFVYMKLNQRSFWSGVNGKRERNSLYQEIFEEYEKGFDTINEAITEGVKPTELRKYVRTKLKNEIINGVDKTPKKYTRKKRLLKQKEDEISDNSIDEVRNDEPVSSVNETSHGEIADIEEIINDSIINNNEQESKDEKEESPDGNEKDGQNSESYKVEDDIEEETKTNDEFEKIKKTNEKLTSILVKKDLKIAMQKKLYEAKEEYLILLDELYKKQKIIRENETKLSEIDAEILKKEQQVYESRGEKE